jgi:hypothetical protein
MMTIMNGQLRETGSKAVGANEKEPRWLTP